jgi:hypothetical protein
MSPRRRAINNRSKHMNSKYWKLLGTIAAVVAAAVLVSMYPDLKRYMKMESM